MAKLPADLRSLARAHTAMGIKVLAGIAQHGTSEAARISAIALLLERGWGKPPQAHTGEGDIRVTIRHIIEDARGVVIEGKPEQLKLVNPQSTADLASDGAD
jgi:hypothetical protein